MTKTNDFISSYLSYIGNSESPTTFHRWSCLSILGAYLGRSYYMLHGHSRINSNIYCMLMGAAGTRKTSAINVATKVLRAAGYEKIAASKTSKEKFIMDLAGVSGEHDAAEDPDDILEANLFGDSVSDVQEILIAADEFNTFVGNGNIEFLSLLGVLWDYDGKFENRVKNSKSIVLTDPVVSLLAGNTPTGFSLAFPIEAIGQGIFSRLILVHGESSGKKIAFPAPPDIAARNELISLLGVIKKIAYGESKLSADSMKLLEAIYNNFKGVGDVRFESYTNRRFTHLLKLCLLVSAASLRGSIEACDVIYANTILSHTEHSMGKALGEFGKARNSDIMHKLIQILESSLGVCTLKDLWKQLHQDLDDVQTLKDMLANLTQADKVIPVKGGFIAKRKVLEEVSENGFVDFSLLTAEERSYIS